MTCGLYLSGKAIWITIVHDLILHIQRLVMDWILTERNATKN